MNTSERIPPNNPRAELAALGCMLCSDRAAGLVVDLLRKDDFYIPRNALLFDLFCALYERASRVDLVEAATAIDQRKLAEKVGGVGVIDEIMGSGFTEGGCERYCRLVSEAAHKRRLLIIGSKLTEAAYGDQSASDIAADAEMSLSEAGARREGVSDPVGYYRGIAETALKALDAPPRRTYGAAFGFRRFDELTGGAIPSSYWIVTARPNIGKSTLLDALLRSLHKTSPDAGMPLFITAEMSLEQMLVRGAASEAGIHGNAMRLSTFTQEQRVKVAKMAAHYQNATTQPYLHHMNAPTIGQIRAVALKHKKKHGLPLLVIDLASKIRAKGANIRERTVEISAGLHELKSDLDTCVIGTVQTSRGANLRDGKEPTLSDLKESGSWEEDADKVLGIHRPGYFDTDDDPRTHVIQLKDRITDKPGQRCFFEYRAGSNAMVCLPDDLE